MKKRKGSIKYTLGKKGEKKPVKKKTFNTLTNTVIVIFAAIILGFGVTEFCLQSVFMTGPSMEQTISNDDELILNKRVSDFPMLTLTNKRRYNGAVCIYYPSVLKEVSETLNSDLIIIPSSIHETIIVPYLGDGDVECCNNMIREVNKQHVAAEEVLSDHAYIYDRKSMSLS